jgi:hypothetical protein
MKCPPPGKEKNSPFSEEQLETKTVFVDELITLGALSLVPHGFELLNTFTLFLVPKPGQPDQWS